jgi:hypothetical protein
MFASTTSPASLSAAPSPPPAVAMRDLRRNVHAAPSLVVSAMGRLPDGANVRAGLHLRGAGIGTARTPDWLSWYQLAPP